MDAETLDAIDKLNSYFAISILIDLATAIVLIWLAVRGFRKMNDQQRAKAKKDWWLIIPILLAIGIYIYYARQ